MFMKTYRHVDDAYVSFYFFVVSFYGGSQSVASGHALNQFQREWCTYYPWVHLDYVFSVVWFA